IDLESFQKKTITSLRKEMLHLNVGCEEKKLENQTKPFPVSGCFKKVWILLINKPQKLNSLICCICNQIADNAMELHCDEHKNVDQIYLVGEQCLQNYLKENNEKYPIQQHGHCEFSQSRRQPNEGVKFEEDEGNCNFKGKMKDLKDHLDKSYNWISVKQSIPYEIINQLNLKDNDNEKDKQIEQINIFNFIFCDLFFNLTFTTKIYQIKL
ncbi:hypothetical protein RFI_35845, partial [Reticulomyxa filosa]